MFHTVALALLLAAAPPAAKGSRAHPDAGPNDAADACETCHRTATPAVFREWEGGPHGTLLVKCFVCHGTTGADFVARPDARRCGACHGAAVASLERAAAPARATAARCSPCHAPHTLAAALGERNPHASP